MDEYKRRMRILHNFKTKYADKIIFDKRTRALQTIQRFIRKHIIEPRRNAIIKIQRFVRRYILFDVINLDEHQIEEIPGIYRYRFKLSTMNEISMIDDMFSLQRSEIDNIEDPDIKAVELFKLNEFKQSMLSSMLSTEKEQECIPVMIDLRIPNQEQLLIGEQMYCISETIKHRIKYHTDATDENTPSGHRFMQMIKWSKVVGDMIKTMIRNN